MARDEERDERDQGDLEYRLVQANTVNEMEWAVRKMIRRGWRPLGGVSVALPGFWGSNLSWYTQAMTREPE
jgi:hypothetical protein